MRQVDLKWLSLPFVILLVVSGYALQESRQLKTGGPAQVAPLLVDLTFVDLNTNQDLGPLANDTTVSLSQITNRDIRVNFQTSGRVAKQINYVRFILTNPLGTFEFRDQTPSYTLLDSGINTID